MEYYIERGGTVYTYRLFDNLKRVKAFTSGKILETWEGAVSELKEKEESAFLDSVHDYGLLREKIAEVKQVHSNKVHYVTKPGFHGDGDGLVTDIRGLVLRVVTADCLPVFLYDSFTGAFGLVHAGWRGLRSGIIENAVEEMASKFNTSPEDIYAAVGPFIQKNCYEVGSEVSSQFPESSYELLESGKALLDLGYVALSLLKKCRIPEKQIEISQDCTYSRNSQYHSYRRDGDRTGRQVSLLTVSG